MEVRIPKTYSKEKICHFAYYKWAKAVAAHLKREYEIFWLNIHFMMSLTDKERQELQRYGGLR